MKTQILTLLALALATINDIEKEVRERCHETTFQKLQGLAAAIEGAHADLSGGDLAAPGVDPLEVLQQTMLNLLNDTSIEAEKRATLQANTVATLGGLMAVLGLVDPTAPA